MPNENPGAYSELRDRNREKKEREVVILETKKEDFEKSKQELRKRNRLDAGKLQKSIETGSSLRSLKSEIHTALVEGTISRDTYDRVIASIDHEEHGGDATLGVIDVKKLPFSQNKFAQYLENQPLGKNIGTDILGFLYAFILQGSAILVIIAWKIITDLPLLPRDIYKAFTK